MHSQSDRQIFQNMLLNNFIKSQQTSKAQSPVSNFSFFHSPKLQATNLKKIDKETLNQIAQQIIQEKDIKQKFGKKVNLALSPQISYRQTYPLKTSSSVSLLRNLRTIKKPFKHFRNKTIMTEIDLQLQDQFLKDYEKFQTVKNERKPPTPPKPLQQKKNKQGTQSATFSSPVSATQSQVNSQNQSKLSQDQKNQIIPQFVFQQQRFVRDAPHDEVISNNKKTVINMNFDTSKTNVDMQTSNGIKQKCHTAATSQSMSRSQSNPSLKSALLIQKLKQTQQQPEKIFIFSSNSTQLLQNYLDSKQEKLFNQNQGRGVGKYTNKFIQQSLQNSLEFDSNIQIPYKNGDDQMNFYDTIYSIQHSTQNKVPKLPLYNLYKFSDSQQKQEKSSQCKDLQAWDTTLTHESKDSDLFEAVKRNKMQLQQEDQNPQQLHPVNQNMQTKPFLIRIKNKDIYKN